MLGFSILFFVVVGICVYLLPWIIAKQRNHHNSLAIFWMNLLLGCTVFFWIVALIWACTRQPPARV